MGKFKLTDVRSDVGKSMFVKRQARCGPFQDATAVELNEEWKLRDVFRRLGRSNECKKTKGHCATN